MKKFLSSVITSIFLMNLLSGTFISAQTLRYAVISPVANIRMAPSLNSDIVHVVNEESEFLVLQEVHDNEQRLWYKLKISDNIEGFIASWVIDSIKTLEQEIPVSNKVVIIEAGVRIRQEPSLNAKINTIVQSTIEKTVISEIKDNANRTWFKIPMNDGSEAWVASWVVTIKISTDEKKSASDKLIVIGENVNIRKGPGTNFDTVTTVTSYMELRGIYEAQDSNGNIWYLVRLPNNVEGWVASWVVEVRKYSEAKQPVSNRIAIIEPIVNVREGPSIQSRIVHTIQTRSEFPVISQGNDINGKLWYEIRLDAQTSGWIASWVVTLKSTDPSNEVLHQANIRSGPGTIFDKIGEANPNTPITIIGSAYTLDKESWFHLEVNQTKGWILGTLLLIVNNPIILDNKLLGHSFSVPSTTEIPLYQGPDSTFPVITNLQKRTGNISIAGIAFNAQQQHWVQVKTPANEIGWVESKLIPLGSKESDPKQQKIKGLSWSGDNQRTTISLAFAEKGAFSFDTITLQQPARYVFDIPHTLLFENEVREEIKSHGIVNFRATQFSVNPDIVRLVVEMDRDMRYLSRHDGNYLIFEFSDYSSYEGPKLHINGVELENHLLVRRHQNELYLPLFLFSNMNNGVLSWDNDKKEAVMLMNRREYRFKADTRYVFIKSPGSDGRVELSHPIATIDQVMHLSIHDFSKVFSTSLVHNDNSYYIENMLIDLNYTKQSDSLVYVFQFSLPARCVPVINEKLVTLTFHHSHLSSMIKIPENPDLERISSVKRDANQTSRTDIVFNLHQYDSFETAMLEDGHQFVFTLKPKKGQGLTGKTIIVDPGHGAFSEEGYYDVGAIGPTGLLESVVNLKIALQVKELLEKAGAKVILTREQEQSRSTLKLQERINMANVSGADLFISIHNNASLNTEAKGSEIFYYREDDEKLAEWILTSLVSSTGLTNRGAKQRGFAVTKNITTMPSVLLECAFLSNPEEERMLQSDSFIQLIAEGIFNGLKSWFDII